MAGRLDLARAVELDVITAALPEHRHFIWRLRAALASRHELERLRNDELRQLRRVYPGATVSGAAKLVDPLSRRCMGSRRGRRTAA